MENARNHSAQREKGEKRGKRRDRRQTESKRRRGMVLSFVLLLMQNAPATGPSLLLHQATTPSLSFLRAHVIETSKYEEPVALEKLSHAMKLPSNPSATNFPSYERVSSHRLEPTNSERLSAWVIVSARVSGPISVWVI